MRSLLEAHRHPRLPVPSVRLVASQFLGIASATDGVPARAGGN